MQTFEANYYDGISPRAKRVLVTIQEAHFSFAPEGGENLLYPIADCHIQAKLGSGKRLIDLPDDSRLETNFQDLETYLPKKTSNAFWRTVHYAETHKPIIFISIIGIILASYAFLQYGVPVMAKYAAIATPPALEKDLGKQTLDTLDYKKLGYFEATQLPEARRKSIAVGLANLCLKTADCPNYELLFRKSPKIGANAFALPGGYVVVTDELVQLAKNDNEIIAVLTHELGHVKGRHALRQTLQGTISGLIIIAITGDVSTIASGLPAIMLNMRYTRDLETEADVYALASLKTACIPTQSFATILLRLEKSMGGVAPPELISSHPDTKLRVAPFIKNTSQCV